MRIRIALIIGMLTSIGAHAAASPLACVDLFDHAAAELTPADLSLRPILSEVFGLESPDKSQYSRVPLEENAYVSVRVSQSGSAEQGFVYAFDKSKEPAKDAHINFSAFARTIKLAPRWAKTLGLWIKARNELFVPDLYTLNRTILSMREQGDVRAPSLMAMTYASGGEISAKLMSYAFGKGYFVIETQEPYYFNHDLLGHALLGYSTLPKSFVTRLQKIESSIERLESHGYDAGRLYTAFSSLIDSITSVPVSEMSDELEFKKLNARPATIGSLEQRMARDYCKFFDAFSVRIAQSNRTEPIEHESLDEILSLSKAMELEADGLTFDVLHVIK